MVAAVLQLSGAIFWFHGAQWLKVRVQKIQAQQWGLFCHQQAFVYSTTHSAFVECQALSIILPAQERAASGQGTRATFGLEMTRQWLHALALSILCSPVPGKEQYQPPIVLLP